MLFRLFKKKSLDPDVLEKSKNEKVKKTVEEEKAKQEAREKKKELGPNLVPVYLLVLTMLMGVFFWVYGIVSQSGISGLQEKIKLPTDTQNSSKPLKRTQEGIVIFERQE